MQTSTASMSRDERRIVLSTLWIVVMFNMVFADIVGLLNPGTIEQMMTMKPPQELMLLFTVLIEIPIAMILLSRVLKDRVNQWANIIAAIVTILWVVGGGNTSVSYIALCTVEVFCLGIIIRLAWNWKQATA